MRVLHFYCFETEAYKSGANFIVCCPDTNTLLNASIQRLSRQILGAVWLSIFGTCS